MAMALEMNANTTHYAGCSEHHVTCALIRVLDNWQEERDELIAELSRGHRDMAEIIDNIASILGRR